MEIQKKDTPNKYDLWFPPEILVFHTTLGSFKSAVSWLTSSRSQVSAHFIIGRLGEVAQLMDLNQGAWHAGVIHKPSERAKKMLRPKVFEGIRIQTDIR